MVSQSLLNNTNVQVTSALGGMQVLEYVQDMSVSPSTSKLQYYMSRMNVNKRQLLLNLNGNGYIVQAGAMQWMAGQIQMESGVKGVGVFLSVLESPVPQQELIMFNLQDDEVKIDGNMAIAWSGSLSFTVEKSSKSLIGSAVSGEGLVNVYRGTGSILMAPTA